FVDNQSSIGQTNESNDIVNGPTITVSASVVAPDLTANSITVDDSTADPGQTITVSYTLQNLGGAAPQSQTKLRLVDPNDVADVLAEVIYTEASIGANTNAQRSHAITVPGNA